MLRQRRTAAVVGSGDVLLALCGGDLQHHRSGQVREHLVSSVVELLILRPFP